MSTDKPFDLTAGKPYQFRGFEMPTYMMPGLHRYLEYGVIPGHFLAAILKNDLSEAVSHADDFNLRNLPAYVGFMYNEMPISSWGSPARVKAWAKSGGNEGRINHGNETRKLSDGSIKNTLTGEVIYPEPPFKSEYGETT